MNLVLLKPNSETGAQVIVLGRPVGNMDVMSYIREKPRMFETIKRAYDELASTVRIMVLEGAGSPAEVNLKSHDVVNMAMARYADARVLLAGDMMKSSSSSSSSVISSSSMRPEESSTRVCSEKAGVSSCFCTAHTNSSGVP